MYTEKNMKGHSIWNSWFLFFSWGARMFFWFSINNFKINNILNYNLQSFYYKTKSIILKSSLSASNSTPPSHPPKILRSPRKNSSEFNALLPKKVWNDEKEDRNVMKFCLPLNPPPQKKNRNSGVIFVELFCRPFLHSHWYYFNACWDIHATLEVWICFLLFSIHRSPSCLNIVCVVV